MRDDDPVHPNYDGIRFQATTDKSGVIAVPVAAQTLPPISYIPVGDALILGEHLSILIADIRRIDERSYFADFLDDALHDLTEAIEACAT
jgi:hypothetical protein